MGLHPEIRPLLREIYCKTAFSTKFRSMKNAVVVDDVLTRVFNLYGPSPGGAFTGSEFFTAFFKPVREAFDQHKAVVFVAICDDQNFVPIEKVATQRKRSAASARPTASSSAILPYDPDSVITKDGICEPGMPVKPFLSARLFKTRSLREQIWRLMLSFAQQRTFLYTQTFVFDFDNLQGPWIFTGREPARQDAELKHNLGEADLGIPFFVNYYDQLPVFITTTDTDVLPVVLCGMSPKRAVGSVIWTYQDKRKGKNETVHVDLVKLRDEMRFGPLKFRVEDFVAFCMLAGTDFVFKSWCFYYFGVKELLAVLQKHPGFVTALATQNPELVEQSINKMVFWLLSCKLNRKAEFKPYGGMQDVYAEPLVRASMHLVKQHTIPDAATLAETVELMLFNYKYWVNQKWNGLPQSSPRCLKRQCPGVEDRQQEQQQSETEVSGDSQCKKQKTQDNLLAEPERQE